MSCRDSEEEEDTPEKLLEKLSLNDSRSEDHEVSSTLKVSLIDYTLSRAYCGNGIIEYAPLDDEALFTGKGKYTLLSF